MRTLAPGRPSGAVVDLDEPQLFLAVPPRYFQCLPKFGLFAPVHKVIRIGFPSTSPAKAKKSKRMAMGVSSLAHSPSSSSISSVSSVASSVSGRPSRAGLVRELLILSNNYEPRMLFLLLLVHQTKAVLNTTDRYVQMTYEYVIFFK